MGGLERTSVCGSPGTDGWPKVNRPGQRDDGGPVQVAAATPANLEEEKPKAAVARSDASDGYG